MTKDNATCTILLSIIAVSVAFVHELPIFPTFQRRQLLDPRRLQMQETDRQEEYRKRNYTWPLKEYVPNTPGWKRLMERRMKQIQCIEDLGERYNGWLSVITSAQVIPNFTEHGFALTRAPPELLHELQTSLYNGLRNESTTTERDIEIITADPTSNSVMLPPLWIEQEELNAKVLEQLRPIHSEFAHGMDLVGAKAYGLRVYRNQSTLLMHSDKPETHIIASILHIDHSQDSKDWPIVIEDLDGNTHEIVMEAGDMLLYESARSIMDDRMCLKEAGIAASSLITIQLGGMWKINTWNPIMPCLLVGLMLWTTTLSKMWSHLRWWGRVFENPVVTMDGKHCNIASSGKGPFHLAAFIVCQRDRREDR